MTDTTSTDAKRESIQAKVAKLLAKAESTDSEHEAETLRAKALDLMAEWGIEAAMIDAGRTQADREKVTENPMEFAGGYAKAMTMFGAIIAQAMGNVRVYERYSRGKSNRRWLHIVGHTSDVERAHMLITSLQLQANTALRAWWKTFARKEWMTQAEKTGARRQFLVSFAEAAAERLEAARQEAQQKQQDAQRATGSAATSSQAGPSVALVLADRRDAVDRYMAHEHPNLTRGRSMQGSMFGANEGAAAGRRADLGGQSVGRGGRAALSA